MSAVLQLPCDGITKNVYVIYDFKQVDDAILMVMYVDKLNSWKKIFINYENGAWDTELLVYYADAETCRQIRNKLNLVFARREIPEEQKALDFEQAMQDYASFMLGIYN